MLQNSDIRRLPLEGCLLLLLVNSFRFCATVDRRFSRNYLWKLGGSESSGRFPRSIIAFMRSFIENFLRNWIGRSKG